VESEDLLRAQGAEGHGVAQAPHVSRKGIIVSTAHGTGSVTVSLYRIGDSRHSSSG